MNYLEHIPNVSYFRVDEISISETMGFMTWHDDQDKNFDNKQVLEKYCQNDVTVLRKSCQIFRREFMLIGKIEVFLESFSSAFECNKFLRIQFFKPNTIGLTYDGGYGCNNNYNKKALMWLLLMEQTHGCRIIHARNGREYSTLELPKYSVDVYCSEKKIIYEVFGCFSRAYLSTVPRNQHHEWRYSS